jgi:hypothetical protein
MRRRKYSGKCAGEHSQHRFIIVDIILNSGTIRSFMPLKVNLKSNSGLACALLSSQDALLTSYIHSDRALNLLLSVLLGVCVGDLLRWRANPADFSVATGPTVRLNMTAIMTAVAEVEVCKQAQRYVFVFP